MMLKEVKKIRKEISKDENYKKANSNIKNSISNLNKLIDDLYKGYLDNLIDVDIEDEGELVSTEIL